MRPRTRILAVTALLALLAATAGCLDGGSDLSVDDAPEPAALQENVSAAMADVETVAFTMEMDSGGSGAAAIDSQGVMNVAEEKARANLTIQSMMGEQNATQYTIGETAYVHMNGQWLRMNMSGMDTWGGNNQVGMQEELLANSSVEVTGVDAVDGNDVWVVSIQPDAEDVQGAMGQMAGMGGISENVEVRDVELTQYVDVESSVVRQVEMDMEMAAQGQTTSTAMTMQFHSFDEPVSISLPPEAENAQDTGAFEEGGAAGA